MMSIMMPVVQQAGMVLPCLEFLMLCMLWCIAHLCLHARHVLNCFEADFSILLALTHESKDLP